MPRIILWRYVMICNDKNALTLMVFCLSCSASSLLMSKVSRVLKESARCFCNKKTDNTCWHHKFCEMQGEPLGAFTPTLLWGMEKWKIESCCWNHADALHYIFLLSHQDVKIIMKCSLLYIVVTTSPKLFCHHAGLIKLPDSGGSKLPEKLKKLTLWSLICKSVSLGFESENTSWPEIIHLESSLS